MIIFKKLLVPLVLVFLLFIVWKLQTSYFNFPNRDIKLVPISIGSQKLLVEVANTPATITKGLGERDQIGSDGMLFVLDRREIPMFWMKGMRFDLDFVWIDTDRVVDITAGVKAQPGAPDQQLATYQPKEQSNYVLELPAGEIARRGIHIGDQFTLDSYTP